MPGGEAIARWWQRLRDPGWVRPAPTARQVRVDALLALAYLGVCLVNLLLLHNAGPGVTGGAFPGLGETLLWALGLSLPFVLRRRFPCSVALLVSVLFIGTQFRSSVDNTTASVALFWAMYSVGAWGRSRMAAFWTRVVIVVGMIGALIVSFVMYAASPEMQSLETVGWIPPQLAIALYGVQVNIGFFVAAGLFGSSAWTSARRRAELERQAAELAAAQESVLQRAVMRERVHIARELHDVVAHHVSVMGVQASAARRVLTKSPELATDALTAVETTARVAIADLRGLLGVLRDPASVEEGAAASANPLDPAESYSAAPGIGDLPDLVAQSESAGLAITFGSYGPARPVPAGASLCVYRVVQEALTNVLKHSGANRAEVRLRYLDAAVEVEITDDGVGRRPSAGGGFGLIGMRERVSVHGGELDAGPRPARGFRVRARLPMLPVVHDVVIDDTAAADNPIGAR